MTTCLSIKNGANQLLRFLLYVSFLLILQNQFLELSRIRCFKPHQLSRDGMIETEFESMQGQASDRIYVFQSIASVADNRMPQILHVYTYLVFSSRFQVQFNKRVSIVTMSCQLSRSVRWVFSSLANIIKPEVSRSRRCTMCTRCCLPERCTYSFKMV